MIQAFADGLKASGAPVHTVIDIGCNLGRFSQHCGQLWPAATRYCVEPVAASLRAGDKSHICTGIGPALKDGARPFRSFHICTATGLTLATSVLRLSRASFAACPVEGPTLKCCEMLISNEDIASQVGSPTKGSAPGLGSPLPHLHRDWALPCHMQRDWACSLPHLHRDCRPRQLGTGTWLSRLALSHPHRIWARRRSSRTATPAIHAQRSRSAARRWARRSHLTGAGSPPLPHPHHYLPSALYQYGPQDNTVCYDRSKPLAVSVAVQVVHAIVTLAISS